MPNLLTNRRILRPWRPDQIPGLALWLDAADLATITLDGSNNVSQWGDKSGKLRHLTQAVDTSRLAYVTNSVNGLGVVRTDGVDDSLVTALFGPTEWFGPGGSQVTMISVFRKGGGTGRYFHGLAMDAAGSGTRLFYTNRYVSNDFYYSSSAGSAGFVQSAPSLTTELSVETVTWSIGGIPSLRRYIAGSPTTYSGTNAMTVAYNVSMLFVVGITTYPTEADYCEIMVWPRVLSETEIGRMESYLVAKWGPI